MNVTQQSDSQISCNTCNCSLMSHNQLLKSDENAFNFSRSSSEGEQSEIEMENRILRNKVWDLELKQREYITKILNLETCLAKMNIEISEQQAKKSRLSIETNMNNIPLTELNGQKKANKKQNKSTDQKGMDSKRGSEEKKFCEVIIKTYQQLFGITSLKQIWKKHKQILAQWLFSESEENANKK